MLRKKPITLGEYRKLTRRYYDEMSRVGKKTKQPSQDTLIRIELQKSIENLISQDYETEEIIKILNENEKYKAFGQYFQIWINDWKKKMGKTDIER